MKLLRIRLQNIKSYADQEIIFNQGVNFISGINGAGKSTIIEAIGYALFDYTLGTISEFLRYGSKTGTITVEFRGDDERDYRVVRKLGTSSLWCVFDLESGGEIDLHGSKDVSAWLKNIMGIGQDMELDHLFRDIVGVPQGTFVAPFLETAAVRKKKFDSILKVEQYRNAYFNTRGAVGTLKDSLTEQEKKLAVLAAEVSDYNEISEQTGNLQLKIIETKEQLKLLEDQLQAKMARVGELEQTKTALENTFAELKAVEAKLEGLTRREKDLAENLSQAVRAEARVQKSEAGYKAFILLEKEVSELETKNREKAGIEKKLNKARQEGASLEGDVQARGKELTFREREIKEQKKHLELRRAEIEVALEEAVQKHKSILNRQDDLVLWEKAEEKLNGLFDGFRAAAAEIKGKQGQLTVLTEEAAGIEHRLELLVETEKKAASLETMEKELLRIREEWAGLKERLKAIEADGLQAADGLCPFLKTSCQNVGGDLKDYFAKQAAKVREEMRKIESRGSKLAGEVKEAAAARDQLIGLQADAGRLEQIKDQKNKVKADISSVYDKIPLKELALVAGELKKYHGQLNSPADKCLQLQQTAANDLQMLQTVAEDLLKLSGQWRNRRHKEWTEEVNEASNKTTRLSTELANVKDSLNLVLEQGKKAVSDKADLLAKEKILAAKSEEINKLTVAMCEFEDLDAMLERARSSQQAYRPDYETYMQNRAEALKKSALAAELGKIQSEIEGKKTLAAALDQQKEQLANLFNPEVYTAEKTQLDKGKEKLATQRQILLERQQDLLDLSQKLERLKDKVKEISLLQKEMGETQKALEVLEIVRYLLNNAGSPVAKFYLENLSREADDIYRQISSDYAVLSWRADYDVNLSDNFQGRQRIRSFKQLSGGEQMTAALAVRLALLKQHSSLRIGFFDEPTANLDSERRMNLAETLPRVTGDFDQLFIISHDDTFDSITDNIIQVKRNSEEGSVLD